MRNGCGDDPPSTAPSSGQADDGFAYDLAYTIAGHRAAAKASWNIRDRLARLIAVGMDRPGLRAEHERRLVDRAAALDQVDDLAPSTTRRSTSESEVEGTLFRPGGLDHLSPEALRGTASEEARRGLTNLDPGRGALQSFKKGPGDACRLIGANAHRVWKLFDPCVEQDWPQRSQDL